MRFFLLLFLLISSTVFATSPQAPNAQLSPGDICTTEDPDYRATYGEGPTSVVICTRKVEYSTKLQVIERYGLKKSNRSNYKIDHIIPLSIGGSNHITNLFPIDKNFMNIYERPEWPVYQAFRNDLISSAEARQMVYQWKMNSWNEQWRTVNEDIIFELEEMFPNPYTD
ncbi:MAG: hypothetical protein KAG61_08410 [Bacteriovoracaceae bacterium]|nr:hypothetical protein [Bacteriovoracaceae bacterium]